MKNKKMLRIVSYGGKIKKLNGIYNKLYAKSIICSFNAKDIYLKNVNFRGSIFNKVKFLNVKIEGCDFWGTKFKKCKFLNCIFSDCNIVSTKFSECIFNKTEFKYTNIVTTCDSMLNKFIDSTCNVYKEYPLISNPEYFDDKLGLLKNNLFLSKTRLFFISNKKINHLTFYLLLQKYSKEFIAEKILHIFNHENINKLTTYNTLKIKLKKITHCDK